MDARVQVAAPGLAPAAAMENCLFCKIARGEVEASVVYKSPACLAFMDVYPISRGHALVIPLEHQAHLDDLDEAARQELLATASRVLAAQRRSGLAAGGANLMLNDGSAANQHVAHVHIHVVPREHGDTLRTALRYLGRMVNVFGSKAGRAELEQIAARIRASLS